MEYFNFLEIINLSLLLHIVLVCSESNTTAENNPGYCRNAESNRVCCAMYYKVDKKCVECPKGTSRLDSDPDCVTCIVGYFGRFCAQKCDCREDQRCDAVQGCVCGYHQDSCKQDTASSTDSTDNSKNEVESADGVFPFIYWLMIVLPVIVIAVAVIVIIIRAIKGRSEHVTSPEPIEHTTDTVNYSYTDFNDNSRGHDIEPGQLAQSAFNNASSYSLDNSEWSDDSSHDSDVYVNVDTNFVQNTNGFAYELARDPEI